MLKIGFANVMYTLWEVTKTDNGTSYRFIKSVSNDEKKVRNLYPDIEIDMSLKGTGSFIITDDKVRFEPNVFTFGKYRGAFIYDENRGENQAFARYLGWAVSSGMIDMDINGEFVVKTMEQNHWHVERDGYHYFFYSPDEWEAKQEKDAELADFIAMAESGNPLTFRITHNCNGNGTTGIWAGHSNDIPVNMCFPQIKEMFYNGITYYIPATGGKGKKVKNNEILITNYEFHAGHCHFDVQRTYNAENGTTDIECRILSETDIKSVMDFETLENLIVIKEFKINKTK